MSELPLIREIERLRAEASGRPDPEAQADFADLLKEAIDAVNRLQQEASRKAQAFERESPKVRLVDVVLAREKAGLAFQTLLQVRNKLIEAYRDIMNMPL